jgi:hypothetical protein
LRFRAAVAGKKRVAMGATGYSELLNLPVTTNGIELGRTVEALGGADGRLIGLALACRDGSRRFLPAGAADIRAGEIRVPSALVCLEERELDWYRGRMTAA